MIIWSLEELGYLEVDNCIIIFMVKIYIFIIDIYLFIMILVVRIWLYDKKVFFYYVSDVLRCNLFGKYKCLVIGD